MEVSDMQNNFTFQCTKMGNQGLSRNLRIQVGQRNQAKFMLMFIPNQCIYKYN